MKSCQQSGLHSLIRSFEEEEEKKKKHLSSLLNGQNGVAVLQSRIAECDEHFHFIYWSWNFRPSICFQKGGSI